MTTATGAPPTGADAIDEDVIDTPTNDDAHSQAEPESSGDAPADNPERSRRAAVRWARIMAYGILPGIALLMACGAGYLKWQADSARDRAAAQTQSVAAASDDTIALLSYRPDTVEKDLGAARERLTGSFRDSYGALIHDVVIPGAKQKQITTTATVPAAAAVSVTANHAVVLVFVDQTITMAADTPTSTASSVKVTLDKIGGRWLISDFTPV